MAKEEKEWVRISNDLRVVYWDGFAVGVGKRRMPRFKSTAEAEAFRSRLLSEASRTAGMRVTRGVTWKDLCQRWYEANQDGVPEGTMRRRLSSIDRWIIPTVGDVLVYDTTLATLMKVADALVKAGTGSSNFDSVIQTMFVIATWADARDALPPSPFGPEERRRNALRPLRAQVKDSSKKVADEGTEEGISIDMVPSWDDVCRLADKVEDRVGAIAKSREVGKRYGRAVRVAAGTGLRLCELLALTPDDINLDNGIIKVRRQLDRYEPWDFDGGEPMPTLPPKFKSSREVVVWAKVRDDLVAAVEDCNKPSASAGFCGMHYRRVRLYEQTSLPPKAPRRVSADDAIVSNDSGPGCTVRPIA